MMDYELTIIEEAINKAIHYIDTVNRWIKLKDRDSDSLSIDKLIEDYTYGGELTALTCALFIIKKTMIKEKPPVNTAKVLEVSNANKQ